MYSLCRRYLSPAEEAEEAMMNGFLKLFGKIGETTFDSEAGFIAWMRRIMINECLQKLRQSKSFLVISEPDELVVPEQSDTYEKLEAKELFLLVASLPPGYRTVFNLYVVEGFTHKEIGEIMHITVGSSKSQLNKARACLYKLWTNKNMMNGLGKAR